ncbi:VanZ family protein [Blastococcus sp. SYSU DS0619]
MITDVLLEHSALVPVTLATIALGCVVVGYAAVRSRRSGRRILWTLTALSALPVLALTLTPSAKGQLDQVVCTVQFALPSLTRVELLANVALSLPVVFFAALASRRPLPVLAVGSVTSAGIEALQALAPAIGRACDTNDWAMNTLGMTIGVALAVGTTRLAAARAR